MGYFLDWWTPIRHIPDLIFGAALTVMFSVIVFLVEIVLGALFGYIRYRKKTIFYPILTAYVEIIRNTPVLVQIYILYFGLPAFGIMLTNYQTAFIALILFGCAFTCEIYRGGIQSIDKGQWEAGECLGMSKIRIFIDIIFPQTLRNIFPSLINQYVSIMYVTSLLSAIDIREITGQAKLVAASTFRTFEMYTFALIFYYVISNISTYILRRINIKYFPSISSKGE